MWKRNKNSRWPGLSPALLVAVVVLVGAPFCGKGEPRGKQGAINTDTRPGLVFLGDSLTAGRGLEFNQAMPALIQRKLDAAGKKYRVINGGRSGDTTAGGLERLPFYLQKTINPQVLVIGLGSNDAMRGRSIASMQSNLLKIVRRARAFNPRMKIFLFQMHTFPNMGPGYAGGYRKMFPRTARAAKITLLPFPLRGVGGVPRLNQPDGIHPTTEGTRIFAENVWKALQPHL